MEQNKQITIQELQEELELKAIPPTVEARMRQVYAQLPDTLPKRKAIPPWARRALCTAASLALACTALLGINGANPALAENLPFIGGIFQAINRPMGGSVIQNLVDTQENIQGMAVEVPEKEKNVIELKPQGLWEKPVTAQLKEVYYDGSFVYAGLEFLVDCDTGWLMSDKGDSVAINGVVLTEENAGGFCDMSSYYWERAGKGSYVMQRAFRVPDELRDADSLEITLGFDGIANQGSETPLNSSSFDFSFTAKKKSVDCRTADCAGLEMGGVKLVSASTTPAGTVVEIDVPDSYINPACYTCFSDGCSMGGLGGTDYSLGNGFSRYILIGGTVKDSDPRNVVASLFDKNGSSQYEAVFVIDFAAGTAKLGTADDVKDPPRGDYAAGLDAVKALKEKGEGYLVSRFFAGEQKKSMFILTPNGYQDLRVELWQDGQMLQSLDITDEYVDWETNARYWEYTLGEDGKWRRSYLDYTGLNRQSMFFDNAPNLDVSAPCTVKIYHRDELVLDQELVWNQPNFGDPNILEEEEEVLDESIEDESLEAVESETEE